MSFLPDLAVMISYSVACLLLFVTPGPDMSLFLAKTMTGGRKAGFACMIGALAGCGVHTVLAALGISALLHASETAFTALKIIGALYLLWMAFGAIRHGSAFKMREENNAALSFRQNLLIGLGINLTNPKVILFFVTFLPQFVQANDPHASAKLFFLGLYFIAFSTPLCILLICGADKVVQVLKNSPKVLRAIDYSFAGLFGAFALKILMLAR